MLDIKFIKENPEAVRQALANRHDSAPLDEILAADAQRRQQVNELEELRRQRKAASKQRQTGEEAAEAGRQLRNQISELEASLRETEETLSALALQLPNIPQADVPVGAEITVAGRSNRASASASGSARSVPAP